MTDYHKEYVKECFLKLKDNGYIIISVPNLMNYGILYQLLNKGNFTYTETGLLDYDHKHFFTLKEIHKMLAICQFDVLQTYCVPDKDRDKFTEKEDNFIKELMKFGDGSIEELQYTTFEYFVIAKKAQSAMVDN